MVVDDDPGFLKMITLRLTMEGYDSTGAESVRTACKCLESLTPDLFIIDMLMPDGDGIEWAGTIKKEYPGKPIIIVTALKSLVESPDPRFDRIHDKPLNWKAFLHDLRVLTNPKTSASNWNNDGQISLNTKGESE